MPEPETPILSPFALSLDGLLRTFRRLAGEVAEQSGLTVHQMHVLGNLWGRGACTMTDLKQELEVTTGAVTGLVDRLERLGLVTRVPSQADRRVTLLELTPAGREAFTAALMAWEKRLAGWLDGVPADQRPQVVPVMQALLAASTNI
jgi:DNA-binding MarR family transcriptional regulator